MRPALVLEPLGRDQVNGDIIQVNTIFQRRGNGIIAESNKLVEIIVGTV